MQIKFIKTFNDHLSKASPVECVTPVSPAFLDCCPNDDSLQSLENKACGAFVTPVSLVTPKNDNVHNYIIEQLEERVAIIEYDGQIPNEWALPIAKIQLRDKPESINEEKWQVIISNLETLPLYVKDIILYQWTISDIFGCPPVAPARRLDVMGLLMLLDEGDRIVEVSKDAIRIRSGIGGNITSYYRSYYPNLDNYQTCLHELEL